MNRKIPQLIYLIYIFISIWVWICIIHTYTHKHILQTHMFIGTNEGYVSVVIYRLYTGTATLLVGKLNILSSLTHRKIYTLFAKMFPHRFTFYITMWIHRTLNSKKKKISARKNQKEKRFCNRFECFSRLTSMKIDIVQ